MTTLESDLVRESTFTSYSCANLGGHFFDVKRRNKISGMILLNNSLRYDLAGEYDRLSILLRECGRSTF